MRLPESQLGKVMKNKTLMDRVRLIGTVLVTPFLVGGAAFGVWGMIDRLIRWPTLAQGGVLSDVVEVSQMLFGVAAAGLALSLTMSLWRRCYPRRRVWENGAAKLPNPVSTRGKYAVWNFQRPSRRQALSGTLTIRKKVRNAVIRPKPARP